MVSWALEDGHAATFQKCFDSGLQYVHDLDMKKKRKNFNSSEVFCSQLCGPEASRGRSHPLPPATSFKMRLRPRQAAAARDESTREKA